MNDINEIWREVQQGLRGFIGKRVADEASVEDLSQEVFVRIQRGLGWASGTKFGCCRGSIRLRGIDYRLLPRTGPEA